MGPLPRAHSVSKRHHFVTLIGAAQGYKGGCQFLGPYYMSSTSTPFANDVNYLPATDSSGKFNRHQHLGWNWLLAGPMLRSGGNFVANDRQTIKNAGINALDVVAITSRSFAGSSGGLAVRCSFTNCATALPSGESGVVWRRSVCLACDKSDPSAEFGRQGHRRRAAFQHAVTPASLKLAGPTAEPPCSARMCTADQAATRFW